MQLPLQRCFITGNEAYGSDRTRKTSMRSFGVSEQDIWISVTKVSLLCSAAPAAQHYLLREANHTKRVRTLYGRGYKKFFYDRASTVM